MASSMPRATFWSEHLAAIDASGVTIVHYAREHQLSAPSLYRWRRQLRGGSGSAEPRRSPAPRFAELLPSVPPSERGVSLRLGGSTLQFDTLPDPAWLAAVLLATASPRR